MFSKAFSDTIKHFPITAKELSAKSGVTEATISRLKAGNHDTKLSTFENLIQYLPQEAKNYLLISALLSQDMSSGDVHIFLTMIASVIQKSNDIQVTKATKPKKINSLAR